MDLFLTLLVDGALVVGLFLSLILATCWGELCGIEPRGDKSGLGGFMAVFLFMPMRWVCTLAGLGWALSRGTLPLVAPGGTVTWLVLGAHLALGGATLWLFQHGLNRVERDRRAGDALGFVGAVVLPLPGLWLGIVGTHPTRLEGTTARVLAAAAVAVVLWLGYRHRLLDMRRSAARRTAPGSAS